MISVLHGDCREVLPTLPAESVNCCVTSPPYWGLRDYGHDGQIGLEKTPEAYVAELVAVFREVRRVLRADGTVWLNLGDSYAAQRGGTQMPAETLAGGIGGRSADLAAYRGRRPDVLADAMDRQAGESNPELAPNRTTDTLGGRQDESSPAFRTNPVAHRNASAFGLKHKDLVGIPWRVAFALQADGWYLRSDIIWAKPNPMPESVTDRPTKSHEYVFLLAKSARYWYDADAIAEEALNTPGGRLTGSKRTKAFAGSAQSGTTIDSAGEVESRNARTVWMIATQPFSGAHFATMPPALAERCIKAGCPEGGTVLDPFGGAGTTGLVADRLGRNAVLIELNPTYGGMARGRIEGDCPLFAEVTGGD